MYQRFLHVLFDLLWAILLSQWFERFVAVLGFALGLLIALGVMNLDLFKSRKQRKAP